MKKNIYLQLFISFFKIGLFTFGGGIAMLPIISKEAIEKHGWTDEDEMTDIVAIAEATPGPIAVNAATFLGYKMGGLLGAIVATFGLALPSIIIISLISLFFDKFIELEYVKYAFMGIRCACALLILMSAIKLFKKIKKTALTYILLIAGILYSLLLPSLSVIYMILGAGVLALICFIIKVRTVKEETENDPS